MGSGARIGRLRLEHDIDVSTLVFDQTKRLRAIVRASTLGDDDNGGAGRNDSRSFVIHDGTEYLLCHVVEISATKRSVMSVSHLATPLPSPCFLSVPGPLTERG